ncbi:hypothetical protein [Bosea sp. ASV33]|uniref:hypothetical protein n=1 Tax=Bosea sp. ASV33 TaxID=2795106 RepID=UPI0018EC9777|nr:hypothetical protein [Bosea sp. ASV33]
MGDRIFDPVAFGQSVKDCSAALGMSVREAAEDSGVPAATFNRVQRGNAPDVENYLRLTAWLASNSWPRPAKENEGHG